MVGKLITSKAGHDKEHLYLVIREEKDFIYASDGAGRTLEHPKRKNRKHVQIIKKADDEELTKRLENGQKVSDEEIKRILKLYRLSVNQ